MTPIATIYIFFLSLISSIDGYNFENNSRHRILTKLFSNTKSSLLDTGNRNSNDVRVINPEDGLNIHISSSPKTNNKDSQYSPILFIHGSFHGAWCWEEIFMPIFANAGYNSYAISLRGTSLTGMPVESTEKSVKIIDHMKDVSAVLAYIQNQHQNSKVVVIAHSFGGMIAMKLLENKDIRDKLASAILMCSVPPSGNGPMTGRFIKTKFLVALKIVYGFVLKKATTNVGLCRELFFGDENSLSESDLKSYMSRFKVDSTVGLDLVTLAPLLPSKTSSVNGVADWIATDTREKLRRLVIGAEKDFIVDQEGVQETASYLGVLPYFLNGSYHDAMLGSQGAVTADLILRWLRGETIQL